ncbi:MAG: molybdopterin-binding protein [Clostridiales bacterium]|nr:molybdopterin-binding protein [Clostridiales bacterium]MCD8133322.1 molybdopterin-binding protein [Clostridiales bacterium]
MKLIRTEDAVGSVLCHDITQIIKGVTKDAVFRKGHIVREEDIPVLLSVGKEHLYVWENDDTMLHENDAAEILYEICAGQNMHGSDVKEGKIELVADIDGLLKIDREHLVAVNALGEMMIASRHGDFVVHKGDKIAATRIIPLVIEKEKMEAARRAAGETPLFDVLPIQKKKVGIVTTGSEVFKGRIKDTFGPVIYAKVEEYGCEVIGQIYVDDEKEHITEAIFKQLDAGAELVICTGGMSVDPDDCTPGAIMNTGARIITYGAPVLPGAMMLVSYYEKEGRQIPILGLPGCVMYAKRTIFDLVLPRVLADDEITQEDIAGLGEGGLCLNCGECTFPNCGFGR